MLIEINAEYPEPRKVRRAVEALTAGALIGYPTDTIYAVGCDLHNRRSVERLYESKHIGRAHQLSLICSDLSEIARYATVDQPAYRVLRKLLPGPYTVILAATREVPKIIQSRRRTVGIRLPRHPVAPALVRALGRPLITTSATVDNAPLLDARELDIAFRGLEIVLDGGPGGTLPTTVIDLTEGVVVREGAGPIDDLF
jgi:tRNA threonylcarbamoyl adenosine modification protein (Sua5/YciO/YrdC/YwlC family)